MPTLNIHLDISGKDEKLLFGPITEPSPGPTFDIEVAAPDKEVTKSSPVNAVSYTHLTLPTIE